MFISIFTALALILQIGAFAVHYHPHTHQHEVLSLDVLQEHAGQHCDLCDGLIKLATHAKKDISFVSTAVTIFHFNVPTLPFSSHFVERGSSRAPPIV
jgi:hypothetical protein